MTRNLYSFTHSKKCVVLALFLVLLPLLLVAANYYLAVQWLVVFDQADDPEAFHKTYLMLTNPTAFQIAVLQTYYVYIAPLFLAVVGTSFFSEEAGSKTLRYAELFSGFLRRFVSEFVFFILLAVGILLINYLTIMGASHILTTLFQNTNSLSNINLEPVGSLIFVQPKTVLLTFLGVLLMSMTEYLFIRLITIFAKSQHVAVFVLAVLHIVHFTPLFFITSYYVIVDRLLYPLTLSQMFYYPDQYIYEELFKDFSSEMCFLALLVTFVVLFVSQFSRKVYSFVLR